MAGYTIRSLGQLAAEAKGALTQAVQGTATKLWPNLWRVESKVLALIGFEMEQRRAWLVRQQFASTADREWLIRHGFESGVQPFPAVAATGSATFPAAPGVPVPVGLQFAGPDGATFTSVAGATPTGATVSLPLEADVAGVIGNTPAGAAMTLVNPDDAPVGFGPGGTVDAAFDGSGLSGGAEPEETEAFRARVLAAKRGRGRVGTGDDYETWVREALGSAVLSVSVDSFQNDARSVWVCVTVLNLPPGVARDDAGAVLAAYMADPTIIIPTAAQIAAAQAYIDEEDLTGPLRRPVTARAFVVAPVPVPVPVVIGGLSPDTPAIRSAVAAELAATFLDRAVPGRPSGGGTFSASWLDEAVSRATGEDRHRLVAPAADPIIAAGRLPVFQAPTYVA